jgi:serine protease Do/serine protease DegQ
MSETSIRRLGCFVLFFGIAAASAQEREVGPVPSLAPLIEQVAPAVVNISVTELVEQSLLGQGFRGRGGRQFFEDLPEAVPDEREGAGSGVIVDAERGYVLTNHHVVADALEIHVVLTDNRSYDATVLGSDANSDIAVLQIEASNLQAIPLASTHDLMVGDHVVAIGNPFGLGQTVTSGIVSALGRTSGGFARSDYEDFIQTDAAINVGNSGGALINLRGELVGINSALVSRTGDSVGVGFAIPAEMAATIMDRLLEYGEVPRGFLGVAMDSVTPNFAADRGLAVDAGAWVWRVEPGSAAEGIGIRIDDVIVGVNGEPIANLNDLRNTIGLMLPGESVDVQVVRDGREQDFVAVLGTHPDARPGEPASRDPREPRVRPSLLNGLEFMSEGGRNGGLRVLSVPPNNPVLAELLAAGDLIKAINREPVRSAADALALSDDERTIVLEVERVLEVDGQAVSRDLLIRLR